MAVGVVAELDCEGSAGAEGDYCCGCLRWRSLGGRYRPTTVLHGTQDATAGDRVHRPLIATAHRQGFGQSGHAVSRNCRSAKRCLTTAHLGIALEAFACVICPIPSFRLFLELAEGHTSSESCGVKDGRLAGCVDDRNYRETTSVTAQTPTRATRHC